MKKLHKVVHLQSNDKLKWSNTVTALLSAAFFFKLCSLSWYHVRLYQWYRSIQYCNDSSAVLNALTRLHNSQLEFTTDTEILDTLQKNNICSAYHQYCRNVMFYTRDLSDIVTVYIKLNTHQQRKISKFPQNMLWFIKQQQLDVKFSLPDHEILSALRCHVCEELQCRSKELMLKRKSKKIMQITCKKQWLLLHVDA